MSAARRWVGALAVGWAVLVTGIALALVALHGGLLGLAGVSRVRLELGCSVALLAGAGLLAASAFAFLRASRAALPLALLAVLAQLATFVAAYGLLGGPNDRIGDGAAVLVLASLLAPPTVLWALALVRFRTDRAAVPLTGWAGPFLALWASLGLVGLGTLALRLVALVLEYFVKVYSRDAVEDLLGSYWMLLAATGLGLCYLLLGVAAFLLLRRGAPSRAPRSVGVIGALGAGWVTFWVLALAWSDRLAPLPDGRFLPLTAVLALCLGAGHAVALAVALVPRRSEP